MALFLLGAAAHALALHQPSLLHAVSRAPRCAAPALMNTQRKGGLMGAVDDVLDYLTNMGGYTGFTESELKAGGNIGERDMTNFGKPTEGIDDNITTAFVILLIAFPSILGLIAVKLYGTPAIFTFAAKDAGT